MLLLMLDEKKELDESRVQALGTLRPALRSPGKRTVLE